MREFLHADDLGQAVLFALKNTLDEDLYNVGTGVDLTIKDLALLIQSVTGHKGKLEWDTNKPDGTPRKLMDTTRLNSQGWNSRIALLEGVSKTYAWFLENQLNLRNR
jgi:GDP-L-fucose synthase